MVSGVAIRKLLDTLGMGSVDELMAGVTPATPNPHGVTTFPFFKDSKAQSAWNDAVGHEGYSADQVWNPLPEGGMRLDYVPDESAAEPQLPFTDDIFGLPFATRSGGDATNALKKLLDNNLGKNVTPELFARAEAEGGLPFALGPTKHPSFLRDAEPQFHATMSPERFSAFDPNRTKDSGQGVFDRIGTHMGTAQAAEERSQSVGGQHTRELMLDTSKPLTPAEALRIAEDAAAKGWAYGQDMRAAARRQAEQNPDVWSSESDANYFLRSYRNSLDSGMSSPDFGTKIAKEEGFTNIPYINQVEDRGSVSNIALTERPGRDAVVRDVAAWNHPQLRHLPNLMAGVTGAGALGFGAMGGAGQADAAEAPPPKTAQDRVMARLNEIVGAAPASLQRDPPPMRAEDEAAVLDFLRTPGAGSRKEPLTPEEVAAIEAGGGTTMYAPEPTTREAIHSGTSDVARGLGMSPAMANQLAGAVAGSTMDPNAGVAGMGFADLVPFLGAGIGIEEGIDAYERGDYLNAGLTGAATALSAIPGGKALAKIPAVRQGLEALTDVPELLRAAGDESGALLLPKALQPKASRARDERFWHPLSNIKLERPIDEMSATVTPTGTLLPEAPINFEALQGKTLIPAFGDRTAAGGVLEALNGQPLNSPVRLEGGADFMREADTGLWASEKGPMGSKAKLIKEVADAGEDPVLAYTAMGSTSGDFSTMMGDAVMGQVNPKKISKAAATDYDKAIREGYGAVPPIDPNWPGIRHPDAAARLRDLPGTKRRLAILEMEKADRRAAGFPDVAAARLGITDPRLLHAKPFDTGLTFGAPDTSGKLLGPDSNVRPHLSYGSQIGGDYLGGLGTTQLPGDMVWRDFFGGRRAAGAPVASDQRAFLMQSKNKQKVDQQMVDTIMEYLQGLQQ